MATAVELRVKTPRVPLTELEQSAFCQSGPLETMPLSEELKAGVRWQRLPEEYVHLPPEELVRRVHENKRRLGKRAVVLGHHYQREDVIQFADFRGDSFKLSQFAAEQAESEFTLFCGVHFMAETAAILGRSHQQVLLPNINAGCSMADMAPIDDVQDCWDDLTETLGPGGVVPVTYMNSVAPIKALCGRNGGIVCTSSNAKAAANVGLPEERACAVPSGPAPRAQHGARLGALAGRHGAVEPVQAAGGQHAGAAAEGQAGPVEGSLLRAHPVHACAGGAGSGAVPGHQHPGAPGVRHGGGAAGRLRGLHGADRSDHRGSGRRGACGASARRSIW